MHTSNATRFVAAQSWEILKIVSKRVKRSIWVVSRDRLLIKCALVDIKHTINDYKEIKSSGRQRFLAGAEQTDEASKRPPEPISRKSLIGGSGEKYL
jgi:hypothetical protein